MSLAWREYDLQWNQHSQGQHSPLSQSHHNFKIHSRTTWKGSGNKVIAGVKKCLHNGKHQSKPEKIKQKVNLPTNWSSEEHRATWIVPKRFNNEWWKTYMLSLYEPTKLSKSEYSLADKNYFDFSHETLNRSSELKTPWTFENFHSIVSEHYMIIVSEIDFSQDQADFPMFSSYRFGNSQLAESLPLVLC